VLSDVDDSDSAKLEVVFQQFVRTAEKASVVNAANRNGVVGYQSMSSIHELESALALADSGIPDNQRPERKDVDENSVELNPRREGVLQII
jgi:hypothetical protein